MSSEQSFDPQLIEQTKAQIRTLVHEIAQFAKSDMAAEEFYAELLPRVVSALAAVGGVIWAKGDQGRLGLQYQVNLQETRLPEKDEEEQVRHGRLLQKVLTSGEPFLVPPHSGAGDGEQGTNPTDYLLVLGALKTELEVVGVLEIFQRPDAGPPTQAGYLRFVTQMCELAAEFLKSRQLRHFSDRQVLWTQLEEFTRLVHASLNPREAAYTIANEGRRLIECDRVSVAIHRGKRCFVEAVSGQDMFDKRSNTIRLLNRLATVVVASGEPMWYSGDTRDMAPQVEDAVQEYVDESHTKMIAVLPLVRPEPLEKERERPDEPDESPPPVGALIVEQIEDSRVQPKTLQRVEVVCQHSASALANALEHDSLFLMPVWRALGKTRVVTKARTLPKVLIVAGTVLGLILALALVPTDFALSSKGTLDPIKRRDVHADVNGVVNDVLVRHGDKVVEGQLLVRLQDRNLEKQVTEVEGKIDAARKAISRVTSQLFTSRALSPDERARLNGELEEHRSQLKSSENVLRVLKEQEKGLAVTSPMAGQVISWDLENRLMGRPVTRGQVMVKIADPSGDWELELHMAEDRLGYIRQTEAGLREKVRSRLREALREPMREQLRQRVEGQAAAQAPLTPEEVESQVEAQLESDLDKVVNADYAQVRARFRDLLRESLRDTVRERLHSQVAAEASPSPEDGQGQAEGQVESQIQSQVEARLPSELDKEVEAEINDRLDVSYTLSNDPGRTHYGKIREIDYAAEPRGEEGVVVLMKVEIDKNDLLPEHLQQGATITAKVACGRCSVGYRLFHDFIAWTKKMWFRWF